MALLPRSRDGRTALFIVAAAVVTATTMWIGFFGITGWLIDSADHEIGTVQPD